MFAALTDAAELDVDANVNEVVAGWRATARIRADKSQYVKADGNRFRIVDLAHEPA